METSNQRLLPICPSAHAMPALDQAQGGHHPRPISRCAPRLAGHTGLAIPVSLSTQVLLESPGVNDEANSLQSAWRVERSPARLLAEAAGPRVCSDMT